MSEIFREQYLKNFNTTVDQLKVIFNNDDTTKLLDSFLLLEESVKLESGQKFIASFNDTNFSSFVKSKIKVFSHKVPDTMIISESLFGTLLPLKNLLNNQPEEVKNVIWNKLHKMYIISELQKPVDQRNMDRLNELNKLLSKDKVEIEDELPAEKPQPNIKNKIHDMLGVNINKETSAMIDDIISSFEKVMANTSSSNPIAGIMEISKLISEKYSEKISKGEIEIDKLMEAISKRVPGMDKMMSGMMGSMKGNASSKPKEKVVIDENFSTASVDVGKVAEESKGFNIGNMLKMADTMGVIPGGKNKDENGGIGNMLSSIMGGMNGGPMPDLSKMMSGLGGNGKMPDISKIMGMMQKLDGTKSKEEMDAVKEEMNTFMQTEMGVDMSKLSEMMNQNDTANKENKE